MFKNRQSPWQNLIPRQTFMWQPGEVEIAGNFEAKLPSGFIGVKVSATGKREATCKVVTMLSHYFLSKGCRCVELCLLARAKLRPVKIAIVAG